MLLVVYLYFAEWTALHGFTKYFRYFKTCDAQVTFYHIKPYFINHVHLFKKRFIDTFDT